MADQQPPPLPDAPDPNLQGPGQVQVNPATGVQPTNAELQQTIALLTAQLQLARQPNPAPPAGMAGAGVHVNPPGRVAAVITPRVGGTIDNMAWVGRPNLDTTAGRLLQPVSINAYRPADFRNQERNDATIKQGISKDLCLELNGSVSLMVWLRTVRTQIWTPSFGYTLKATLLFYLFNLVAKCTYFAIGEVLQEHMSRPGQIW